MVAGAAVSGSGVAVVAVGSAAVSPTPSAAGASGSDAEISPAVSELCVGSSSLSPPAAATSGTRCAASSVGATTSSVLEPSCGTSKTARPTTASSIAAAASGQSRRSGRSGVGITLVSPLPAESLRTIASRGGDASAGAVIEASRSCQKPGRWSGADSRRTIGSIMSDLLRVGTAGRPGRDATGSPRSRG